MKKMIYILSIVASSINLGQAQTVPASDSLALVALYNSTDGANWTNNTNWLVPATTIDTWFGVTVNGGRIEGLDLQSNNLIGTIPVEIGNLTAMTVLNMEVNQLSGSIPIEIGGLSNLTQLDLYFNQLSGDIPTEIVILLILPF